MLEQTVEIALGPKGAFENGSVGTLKRHVTADRVVNAAARARRSAKSPRERRTPRVVELLQKAQEWRRQLDAGEVQTQAEIARREGITRARVTQVIALLRLPPEAKAYILDMADAGSRSCPTERALRPLLHLAEPADQIARFHQLVSA